MEEIWITFYESCLPKRFKQYVKYEVSNFGRVKRNGELFTPKINERGYYVIFVANTKNNKRHKFINSVHRIVAENFIPNPLNLPQVDHIDGNKLNNHYTNLRWVTNKENSHNPVTRQKFLDIIKSPEMSEKISIATKKAMEDPEIRKKCAKGAAAVPLYNRGKCRNTHRVYHEDGTWHMEKNT